jgi:hypothetical protein
MDIGSSAQVKVSFVIGTESGDLPDMEEMLELLKDNMVHDDYLDEDNNVFVLALNIESKDWEEIG